MIRIIIVILASIIILGTILSIIPSYRWWLRVWDYPRVALICAAVIIMILALIYLTDNIRNIVILAMAMVLGWQIWRIYPYTPLAPTEVARAQPDKDHCFKVLAFNVLQTNRDYAATLKMLEREDPDIILLLETDQKWVDAMAPIARKYPHQSMSPLDNLYGLTMMTRLKQHKADIRHLVDADTPSVFAWLETPGGQPFHFIGLHPRPPRPGENTQQRDAEIAIAARMAAKEDLPVLATGDFNDVGWSRTSQIFKRIGGYLDPRIGRGLFATFPANVPLLRWPLDHVFFTPEFTIVTMQVLENLGSDHLPIAAKICLSPKIAPQINEQPEQPDGQDHDDANQMIRDGLSVAPIGHSTA